MVLRRFGYVYLIQIVGFDLYKIGSSSKVEERLAVIQAHNPFDLVLIHTIASKRCKSLEFAIHEQFKSKQIRGEWFKLTEDDVAQIKLIVDTNEWIVLYGAKGEIQC